MSNQLIKEIPVTKKHILNGTPQEGESCAIALALQDQGFEDVNVDGHTISFMIPVTVSTPALAKKFIEQFDEYEEEIDDPNADPNDSYYYNTPTIPNPVKITDVVKPISLTLKLNGKASITASPATPSKAKKKTASKKKAAKKSAKKKKK